MTDHKVKQALFEKVQEVVAEQLRVSIDNISLSAGFIDDLGADSLDLVELIMAFEEEFEQEVADEDAEKLTTIGDVVDYMYENGVKP